MNGDDIVALVIAVLIGAYVVVALLFPEKL